MIKSHQLIWTICQPFPLLVAISTIKMIDDVTETSARGSINLEEVKSLWKFQVHREQSEKWALRDVRFLVYDDTDVKLHGYDSDDEEAMIQRALEMSREDDSEPDSEPDDSGFSRPVDDTETQHALENAISGTSTDLEVTEAILDDEEEDLKRAIALSLGQDVEDVASEARPRQDEKTAGCGICAPLPEFPHAIKARKFRLFRPTEEQLNAHQPCVHYVAVSYCWPEPVLDDEGNIVKSEGSYQIRDLDGRVRKSRAPDDILDRAVDFANTCGLRMIWIDQECLPQPTQDSPQEDKDYQQTGVQSMDILYNRAIVTAGLHTGGFGSQAQLEAVQELIALNEGSARRRPPSHYDHEFLSHVESFLGMVCRDRWYTRAWVVQEALSSGSSLFLVFRLGNALTPGGRIRFRDRYTTPEHSLDTKDRAISSSQIHIQVDSFRGLVRAAQSLFEPYFTRVGSSLAHQESFSILSAAASLHPTVANTNQTVQMTGRNIYGNRQRLDGASALTLLKSRNCWYPEDRIAILANMCGYEVRLNTEEVAKHCKSLRVGLLAIMLLNGDVSALAPEVYPVPSSSGVPSDSGLLSSFDSQVGRASYCSVKRGNLMVPHVYTHSHRASAGNGLPLHAYLWAVEGELDLTPIKLQWEEKWNELKCIQLGFERLEGESGEALDHRKRIIAQYFSRSDIRRLATAEVSHHGGSIPNDSPLWAGLPPGVTQQGLHITAHLNANLIQSHPDARHIVAQIIFRTLEYLFDLSASDPRAASAANSIWHSIRTDSVRSNGADELPDSVGPALFTQADVLRDAFATLQLDRDDTNGGYRQLWFIDRIMTQGTLWIGRYIPAPAYCPKTPARNLHPQAASSTILSRQLTLQFFTTLSSMVLHTGDQAPRLPSENTSINSSSLAYFAYLVSRDAWSAEADEKRARELVAVFDVDGPCTVATPFVPDWEMLPRPGIRGMSVCWVVEEALVASKEDGRRKEEELVADVKVDEGEPGGLDPAGVQLDPGSGEIDTEDSGADQEEKGGDAEGRAVLHNDGEGEPTVYRVVNKVKGLWEIIEMVPQQYYVFT